MLQVTTPRSKLSTMQTRYENHISIHVKHFLPANIKMKHKFGVNQHDWTNSHLVHTSTVISSTSGRSQKTEYIYIYITCQCVGYPDIHSNRVCLHGFASNKSGKTYPTSFQPLPHLTRPLKSRCSPDYLAILMLDASASISKTISQTFHKISKVPSSTVLFQYCQKKTHTYTFNQDTQGAWICHTLPRSRGVPFKLHHQKLT